MDTILVKLECFFKKKIHICILFYSLAFLQIWWKFIMNKKGTPLTQDLSDFDPLSSDKHIVEHRTVGRVRGFCQGQTPITIYNFIIMGHWPVFCRPLVVATPGRRKNMFAWLCLEADSALLFSAFHILKQYVFRFTSWS